MSKIVRYTILMQFKRALLSLTALSFLLVGSAVAQTPTFTTSLRVGDTHPSVLSLQKVLNLSPDTQVSSSGAGSPGLETTYFGAKTLSAVKRFQTKYRSEVLTPAGLTTATGFVGPMTLQKLRVVASVSPTPVAVVPTPSATPTPTPIFPTPAVPTSPGSVNIPFAADPGATAPYPNEKNLELYISATREAMLANGTSPTVVALVEKKIRDNAATGDYRKAFYDKQKEALEKQQPQSILNSFLNNAVASLEKALSIPTAHAALAPGIPFGGFITYVDPFICSCSAVMARIFVALPPPYLPPITNILVDYTYGSQAFPYFNIPLQGIAVLGTYVPAQSCYTYVGTSCVLIPSAGTITPVVGSSLVI